MSPRGLESGSLVLSRRPAAGGRVGLAEGGLAEGGQRAAWASSSSLPNWDENVHFPHSRAVLGGYHGS